MGAVRIDSAVLAQLQACKEGRGLVVGQRLPSSVLLVLQLVPLHVSVPGDVLAEQTARLLPGGLAVLGVYSCSDDAGQAKQMLWTALACGRPLPPPPLLWLLAAPPLAVRQYDPAAPWGPQQGVRLAWSKGGDLRGQLTLHSATLAIRMGVRVSDTAASVGGALEKGAKALGKVIEENVAIGSLRNKGKRVSDSAVQVWARYSGPIKYVEPGSNLFIDPCTIAGWAVLHPECPDNVGTAFLRDDLIKSVTTRIAVLLDELEAKQEESADPSQEHVLSRYRAGATLPSGLRWTLPRRVLVRTALAGVPECDWQMPGEYDGVATVERWHEILGVKNVELNVIDGTLEPPPQDGGLFSLTGEEESGKLGAAASLAGAATESRASLALSNRSVVGALLAAMVVIVAIIVSRL